MNIGWTFTNLGAESTSSTTVSREFMFPFIFETQRKGSERAFWRGVPSRDTPADQNLRGYWNSKSRWSDAIRWRTIEGCKSGVGEWWIVLTLSRLYASYGLLWDVSSCWTISSRFADKNASIQWVRRTIWYVDPAKRITVREALESEFVAAIRRPEQEVGMRKESDGSD